MIRVPHSSGMLEGRYTKDTEFAANDHRRHRPKEWLTEGLRKVEQLGFLTEGRTLGQAAIQWLLAEPAVTSVLPNIYDSDQLREFAAAPGDARALGRASSTGWPSSTRATSPPRRPRPVPEASVKSAASSARSGGSRPAPAHHARRIDVEHHRRRPHRHPVRAAARRRSR